MSEREPFYVDGHGLVLAGHADRLRAPREAARQWLLGVGASSFFAEQQTELTRVELAWWGGADVGFAGADHPGARPVTVVHIPDGRG